MFLSIDFDAFYCAVEEHRDPSLKDVPFIVAQKNCVATLSYAARALGLKKLDSVRDTLGKFPDLKVVNGESLAKYREEGKRLTLFLTSLFPGLPLERLGLEEMRIDITKCVEYNQKLLPSNLSQFGEVDDDAAEGIDIYFNEEDYVHCDDFFLGCPSGKIVPDSFGTSFPDFVDDPSSLNAYIAFHIAALLMDRIELEMDYKCSIGVATSRTLAKMVCSLNKPNGVTVLIPSYNQQYLDQLLIRQIPGFGSKIVESIGPETTVAQLRSKGPENKDINTKLWNLLHGVDGEIDETISIIPKQISVEDSYINKWNIRERLASLADSLTSQVYTDLIDANSHQWIAKPQSLRVAVQQASISRRSKTGKIRPYFYDLPHLTYHQRKDFVKRLLQQDIMPLFNQITAPDVRLVNLCVTNFVNQ